MPALGAEFETTSRLLSRYSDSHISLKPAWTDPRSPWGGVRLLHPSTRTALSCDPSHSVHTAIQSKFR